MIRVMTAVQLSLVVLLTGCNAQGELEQRTRRYFEMSPSQQVSMTTIRAAILSRVPLGSSANDVHRYLEARGIGKDGLSSHHPVNDTGEIVCRIEYNPKTLDVVKKSFGVIFAMDANGKLRDIEVKEWLTGP